LGAVLFTVGLWLLDLFTLMAALAAVGSRPSLIPVIVAYCVAQILAQIPLTPGGLGFVEAGVTATLALAGVSAADAALARLAYRVFSCWLPLPVGLVAVLAFRLGARLNRCCRRVPAGRSAPRLLLWGYSQADLLMSPGRSTR